MSRVAEYILRWEREIAEKRKAARTFWETKYLKGKLDDHGITLVRVERNGPNTMKLKGRTVSNSSGLVVQDVECAMCRRTFKLKFYSRPEAVLFYIGGE